MKTSNRGLKCRRCGQPASRGVLLLLDENGAICPYCRSLERAGGDESKDMPTPPEFLMQHGFTTFRNFCQQIQDHTHALDVFLFSGDGHPLGYSSDRLAPRDLAEMGDLISSVISSYQGIFSLLGGDAGFILVGKEECHCLVRSVPPKIIMAVIVEPEYPIELLKTMLKPFVSKLERFQRESAG
jgi:hypothetical protein